MIKNGYTSRNIPDPGKFKDVYDRRIRAKKNGDKKTSNNLKLILNTAFGATLNRYNALYDPLQARSICISGQLYLLELAEHLAKDIPDLIVAALNTDGIMVEFDDSQHEAVMAIVNEWQERTGFNLEEDKIKMIVQSNVNNYCLVMEDGEIKCKGGYLVRGIAKAGAFNINNNATVIATALREYLVNGTAPEETIEADDNILDYQLIAKAGGKYSKCFIEQYDEYWNRKLVEQQKCNRVYASKDIHNGTLFKKHKQTGTLAKIPDLPLCCVVDNDNHLTIDAVDKDWYIRQTYSKIRDFLGVDPPKKGRKVNSYKKNILKILGG